MTPKPFFLGMSRLIVIACFAAGAWGFIVEGNLSAAKPDTDRTDSSRRHADARRRYVHAPYGDSDSYAAAHSDPDGYTNGNGYVYADANSVTQRPLHPLPMRPLT